MSFLEFLKEEAPRNLYLFQGFEKTLNAADKKTAFDTLLKIELIRMSPKGIPLTSKADAISFLVKNGYQPNPNDKYGIMDAFGRPSDIGFSPIGAKFFNFLYNKKNRG